MRSEHTWIWTEACSSGSTGGRLGGGGEGAGSRSGEGTPPRAARVRVPGVKTGDGDEDEDPTSPCWGLWRHVGLSGTMSGSSSPCWAPVAMIRTCGQRQTASLPTGLCLVAYPSGAKQNPP